jgi:hypothetical protein
MLHLTARPFNRKVQPDTISRRIPSGNPRELIRRPLVQFGPPVAIRGPAKGAQGAKNGRALEEVYQSLQD